MQLKFEHSFLKILTSESLPLQIQPVLFIRKQLTLKQISDLKYVNSCHQNEISVHIGFFLLGHFVILLHILILYLRCVLPYTFPSV